MTGGGCCRQEGEGDSHTACRRVTLCHMCSTCVVSVCGECAVGMSAVYSGIGVRWMCKKVGVRRMCGRGCWVG